MEATERLLEVIRGRNAKTIGLQFPVGLRTKAVELAQEIEARAGVTCLVSADPSFGACDAADMPVDLIVHLGHAPMPHLRYNRVFFYDLPGAPLASMAFVDAAEPMLPKRKQIRENLARLDLWVNRTTLLLDAMTMTFASGDTKTMTFEDVVPNAPIAPGTFAVDRN